MRGDSTAPRSSPTSDMYDFSSARAAPEPSATSATSARRIFIRGVFTVASIQRRALFAMIHPQDAAVGFSDFRDGDATELLWWRAHHRPDAGSPRLTGIVVHGC